MAQRRKSEDRIVSPRTKAEDSALEQSLRPKKLADFVGQDRVKENLGIAIAAAKQRGEPLDHVLFYGPPGLGKTTLAYIAAQEMQVGIKVTSGPAIERPGDMASILTNLKKGDVLFVDEIHRLGHAVEEVLYPALEDFALDIILGKGPGARSLRLHLTPFTLVGATTRYALLSAPLRDRFGSVFRLDFYDEPAILAIVERSARILGVEAEEAGIREIARRSRGTPRIANRLLRRVRDYAQVRARGIITLDVAKEALAKLDVDPLGLDDVDHKILKSIIEKFEGGPVGLDTVAASISEEPDTIMDVYEPFLLQQGFLNRTPRGRTATRLAYQHLGLVYPEKRPQLGLWDKETDLSP